MSFLVKNLPDVVRGDDWTFRFTITSNGSPVDLTSFIYRLTLKIDKDEDDPGALQITTPAQVGGDAVNGILTISVPRANTDNLAPATYNYDVQQTGDGLVQTILIGKIKVVGDITRTT